MFNTRYVSGHFCSDSTLQEVVQSVNSLQPLVTYNNKFSKEITHQQLSYMPRTIYTPNFKCMLHPISSMIKTKLAWELIKDVCFSLSNIMTANISQPMPTVYLWSMICMVYGITLPGTSLCHSFCQRR